MYIWNFFSNVPNTKNIILTKKFMVVWQIGWLSFSGWASINSLRFNSPVQPVFNSGVMWLYRSLYTVYLFKLIRSQYLQKVIRYKKQNRHYSKFWSVYKCASQYEYHCVEQRTIFRRRNHISQHFTIINFNVLEQFLAISLNLLGKNVFLFHWH